MQYPVTIAPEYDLAQAAAREADRPVLRSVFLDHRGYAVASNGFIMAVVPIKYAGPDAILPLEALRSYRKVERGVVAELTIDFDAQLATVTGTGRHDRSSSWPLIQGSYPNWPTIIPVLGNGDGDNVHSAYAPDSVQPLCLAINTRVFCPMAVSASYPGLILGYGGALGVIMPTFIEQWPEYSAHTIAAVKMLREKLIATPLEATHSC